LSSSNESSGSDSLSLGESDCSEDSVKRQFVEKARQRERQRQREHQALESDSELSELASSTFDGMEGVELGSGIKIGQEDQEMGSIELGGDSEVPEPVVSPRKTRSGRVRK
jgi:hypothetical protein